MYWNCNSPRWTAPINICQLSRVSWHRSQLHGAQLEMRMQMVLLLVRQGGNAAHGGPWQVVLQYQQFHLCQLEPIPLASAQDSDLLLRFAAKGLSLHGVPQLSLCEIRIWLRTRPHFALVQQMLCEKRSLWVR